MINVLGVIPARYGSTRLPAKMLAPVNGKPLIEWVWRAAAKANRLDRLVIATDDERIVAAVKQFGGESVMTDSNLPSGTDRVWEAAKTTDAQIIVNIQGDEPMLQAAMIDSLVEAMQVDPAAPMATLRFAMKGSAGYLDPNVVKVVTDAGGWACYFSRSPVPFYRDAAGTEPVWYKHLGFYAYRRPLLEQFVQWPQSALELAEKLEQLRVLERGVRIKVIDSPRDTVAVDTADDLKRVEQRMSKGD